MDGEGVSGVTVARLYSPAGHSSFVFSRTSLPAGFRDRSLPWIFLAGEMLSPIVRKLANTQVPLVSVLRQGHRLAAFLQRMGKKLAT